MTSNVASNTPNTTITDAILYTWYPVTSIIRGGGWHWQDNKLKPASEGPHIL
jgi:hypothetical protein